MSASLKYDVIRSHISLGSWGRLSAVVVFGESLAILMVERRESSIECLCLLAIVFRKVVSV